MWLANWFKKRHRPQEVPKKDRLRILVLSVSLEDRIALERVGRMHEWELRFANTQEGFRLLSQSAFEVVLLDRNQYGNPWREVLESLAAIAPRSCVLLISPVNDDYLWREVLHRGGYDILTHPLQEGAIAQTIRAAALFASTNAESVNQPVTEPRP
jgi:DNA-binding NarL/FixJ family response regulator